MNNKVKQPRVFVTQETTAVDYTPATKFGDLVFVTGVNDRITPYQESLSNAIMMDKINSRIADFNDSDYLICTGAPTNMAIVANKLGAKLKKILAWDNRTMSYFEVNVK